MSEAHIDSRKEAYCNIECWPKGEVKALHDKVDKIVIYMERLDAVLKFLETSPRYILSLMKVGMAILAVAAAIYGALHKWSIL